MFELARFKVRMFSVTTFTFSARYLLLAFKKTDKILAYEITGHLCFVIELLGFIYTLVLLNICGSLHHAFIVKIIPTRRNNCVLFFSNALLYMFRVTIPPIIRSTCAVYGHR